MERLESCSLFFLMSLSGLLLCAGIAGITDTASCSKPNADDPTSLLSMYADVHQRSGVSLLPGRGSVLGADSDDALLAEDDLPKLEFLEEEASGWKEDEQQCRAACKTTKGDDRRVCYARCFGMVPPEVRVFQRKNNMECWEQFYGDGRSRVNQCTRTSRALGEMQAEDPTIIPPDWLVTYEECFRNETYSVTGDSRTTGCDILPRKNKKQKDIVGACHQECYLALPARVRVYKMECEDQVKKRMETDATILALSKSDRNTLNWNLKELCFIKAADRIKQEDDARNAIGGGGSNSSTGGGGGGGASLEALVKLKTEIDGMKQWLEQKLSEQVSDTRQALTGLMAASRSVEEITRQKGATGITNARTYRGGTKSYHSGSYATPAMANSHNHANGYWTVGLGEFAGVVNGVTFRTRHNDYKLVRPSTTEAKYHLTEDFDRPPVPPEVTSKATVDEQISEMRHFFQAFKTQNVSHRNYKPYFKPVLCYLECAWEKLEGDDLVEPFASDRHHIAATTWSDLMEKVRFYDLSGGKDQLENIPWLPVSVMSVDIVEGRLIPQLAKWSYRILCHPIDGDVETVRLHLMHDSQVKLQRQNRFTQDEAYYSRDARFRVDPRLGLQDIQKNPNREVAMGRNYLDLLMEQIPGKDNYIANLTDDIMSPVTSRLEGLLEGDPKRATKGTAIGKQHEGGPLNVGYYSRYYQSGLDAMGRGIYKRGWSDINLWTAMSSHENLANISMMKSSSRIKPGEVCLTEDNKPCPRISQRWSYAMPVEIIYMTPLFNWNPYNLTAASGTPTGAGTKNNPYSHVQLRSFFYQTPASFWGSCSKSMDEPPDTADTDRNAVYVKDQGETPQAVTASGVSISTSCIQGVGKVRIRYNIMPLHAEGSPHWKEVKALEKLIHERLVPEPEPEPEPENATNIVKLVLEGGIGDGHHHQVALTNAEVTELHDGKDVTVTSTISEAHQHTVTIKAVKSTADEAESDWEYVIVTCGKLASKCADGHDDLREDEFDPR